MAHANVLADIIGDVTDSQTTAGTSQSDAATACADHVLVSSPTTGQGVILTPGNSGDIRSVGNGSTLLNFYVYPPSGASFNGASANAPVDLPPRTAALFIFVTSTKINVII